MAQVGAGQIRGKTKVGYAIREALRRHPAHFEKPISPAEYAVAEYLDILG
jgi:hypothetical protein